MTEQPCDRTDLPELADMHCPCGFEAGEHPAWRRRAQLAKAARSARLNREDPPDGDR